jgi:hypothetical protein
LEDILKYREWAFIEIRLEAKAYFNSQKEGVGGKGIKSLLDVWTNVINNEEAFTTSKK